jgi:DNA invertase Pin-like site-specific DNA recombinase
MAGQKVGYIRVSSSDQNIDRQLEGLILDKTFTDRVSGKSQDRPALQGMLQHVREGDEVVVHSMDRLARNLADLLQLVTGLTGKGVKVTFQKEALTFTGEDNPIANLMLSIIGAVAAFERSMILERQREGIALAKARGAYKGRKPCLTPGQKADVRHRAAGGEKKTALAVIFGVSRETIYQALREV